MSNTFQWQGHELAYLDHPYNTTRLNERAVEVPIALQFIAENVTDVQRARVLEVGNVLGHYTNAWWSVADRYEPGEGVMAEDLFDLDGRRDVIVAISTLEHVRWDPPEPREIEPTGGLRAIEHLLGLLAPGGRMLVTVPFGQQPYLDSEIIDGKVPEPWRACTMVRVAGTGPRSQWVPVLGAHHERYAATSLWAEAVWVAEYTT